VSVEVPSADRIRQLARLSAGMDAAMTSKLAIVAPGDFEFGLGRMYEAFRELQSGTKQVNVFRSLEEALAWLGQSPTRPE
jgi:hypothetical protein